ncbi:hypothetical protein FRB90_008631 [Tulasnella sp. 427]|nr:hypothetical protein FRB90_008631 [Tulasnella sp. 427]
MTPTIEPMAYSSDDTLLETWRQRIAPFRISLDHLVYADEGKVVASGGFGQVRKATYPRDMDPVVATLKAPIEGVKVAVKTLQVHVEVNEDRLEKRFIREAYVWSQLKNDNITDFVGFHFSSHEGKTEALLVCPWMENGQSTAFVKRNGLSVVERLQLLLDAAKGIEYLHSRVPPICHGDIKGSNVLIKDNGRAAISDFGLAQVLDEEFERLASQTIHRGTVRWTSPERLDNDGPLSPSSDVWSWAWLTWEIMTEHIPFHHVTNSASVIFHIITLKLPACEEEPNIVGVPTLPKLLQQCWQKEPGSRLHMKECVERLEDILEEFGVAEPVKPSESLRQVDDIAPLFESVIVKSFTPIRFSPNHDTDSPETSNTRGSYYTAPSQLWSTAEYSQTFIPEDESNRFSLNMDPSGSKDQKQDSASNSQTKAARGSRESRTAVASKPSAPLQDAENEAREEKIDYIFRALKRLEASQKQQNQRQRDVEEYLSQVSLWLSGAPAYIPQIIGMATLGDDGNPSSDAHEYDERFAGFGLGSHDDSSKGEARGRTSSAKAADTLPHGAVAIKPLKLTSNDEVLADFELWLRDCGSLNHVNVMEFLGTAVLNDIPVVISKFCSDGNIMQYLERNPQADRRDLLQQVADGLNYLLTMPPGNPIKHSNLKPSNILVDHGTVRLGDVGLLGWLEDHNAEGDVQGKIGDLRWTAPEVLEGQSRQWWSDVYSFACLALYILRDEIPYASLKTDTAVSKAIYRGDLPLDRGRMSTIHPTWKLCWSHDPQRRPTMATILGSLPEW